MSASKETAERDLVSRVVNAFSSVRLTIGLILAIAVISFAGTTSRAFSFNLTETRSLVLDFSDVYHSVTYRALLGLLFTNLLVCTLNLLPGAWRRYQMDGATAAPPPPREADHVLTVTAPSPEQALARAEAAVFGASARRRRRETPPALVSFRSTGRLSILGPQVTHLGVLLIIAGGLIGSLATFEASVYLKPGQQTDIVYSRIQVPTPGAKTGIVYLQDPRAGGQDKFVYQNSERRLDFAIRCNDFNITFYPGSAMPSDYLADLSIIAGGTEVRRAVVEVNQPLTYRGYGVYQSSYEPDNRLRIVAEFAGPDPGGTAGAGAVSPGGLRPGDTVSAVVGLREPWTVPGDTARYMVLDFAPSSAGMEGMGDMGPMATGSRIVGDRMYDFKLFERYPDFDRKLNRRGDRYFVSFRSEEAGWRTGLQIIRDPGLPVTWAGFALLVAGAFQSLVILHRRYWLAARTTADGRVELRLTGRSKKGRAMFARRLERMAGQLEMEFVRDPQDP